MSYVRGDIVEVRPPLSITKPNEGLTEVQIVDTDDATGMYGVTNILQDLDYHRERSKIPYDKIYIMPERIHKFIRRADRAIRTPERRTVKKHGGRRRTGKKLRRRHRK
jgi:hypothetical protein